MKYTWLFMLLAVISGMTFLTPAPALAQFCESECEPEPEPEPEPLPDLVPQSDYDPPSPPNNLNEGNTRAIVRILEGASATCDNRISLRYRVDCLKNYYGWVAASLPDRGDYAPLKRAMLDAEAKLDAIVRANLDEGAPTISPREKHKPAANRVAPIRAVREDRAEAAAAEALAVVEELELVIIRSGGDPARRTPHYNAIAAAVEDNLVVLRSA
jgi:hypothetical protein